MFISLLIPMMSLAASDSVAVFHRPDKVVVQINERGGAGGRLQQMMSAWGAGNELFWQTEDKSFYLNCGRRAEASSCVMRILPSAIVQIREKDSKMETSTPSRDFAVEFISSRGHIFRLASKGGMLRWFAKRP